MHCVSPWLATASMIATTAPIAPLTIELMRCTRLLRVLVMGSGATVWTEMDSMAMPATAGWRKAAAASVVESAVLSDAETAPLTASLAVRSVTCTTHNAQINFAILH